jgi:hypothetical protein
MHDPIYSNHHPAYQIGDILKVETSDYQAYLLIEDMDKYSYFFRNLLKGSADQDSIYYVDNHKFITKVA